MEEIVDNNRHRKGSDVENFCKSSRVRILQRERENIMMKKVQDRTVESQREKTKS